MEENKDSKAKDAGLLIIALVIFIVLGLAPYWLASSASKSQSVGKRIALALAGIGIAILIIYASMTTLGEYTKTTYSDKEQTIWYYIICLGLSLVEVIAIILNIKAIFKPKLELVQNEDDSNS